MKKNEIILGAVAIISLLVALLAHAKGKSYGGWIALAIFVVTFGILYVRTIRSMRVLGKQAQRGLSSRPSIPPAIRNGNVDVATINTQVVVTVLAIEGKAKRTGMLKVLRKKVTSNANGTLGTAYEVISDKDGVVLNTNSLNDAVSKYNSIIE